MKTISLVILTLVAGAFTGCTTVEEPAVTHSTTTVTEERVAPAAVTETRVIRSY